MKEESQYEMKEVNIGTLVFSTWAEGGKHRNACVLNMSIVVVSGTEFFGHKQKCLVHSFVGFVWFVSCKNSENIEKVNNFIIQSKINDVHQFISYF